MTGKSESRDPESDIRSPRLPVHLRRLMPREHRRAENLWAYTQALIDRLGIDSGGFTAKVHDGRVTDIWLAWCRGRGPVLKWPDRKIATRIQRLLAGSRLRYGSLTVEIVHGQVEWITPAPRFKRRHEELTELGRLFDSRR